MPDRSKSMELPTALHSLFGAALFLFGNLIAQDPSCALPGEPTSAIPYWIGALDVFETGESLHSRTSGPGAEAPQDWRMAIIWGRTLVCLADDTLSRRPEGTNSQPTSCFADPEPNWPQSSPFYTIARRRPPATYRMTLTHASANDLMMLAIDQSRAVYSTCPIPNIHNHHRFFMRLQRPIPLIQTPLSTSSMFLHHFPNPSLAQKNYSPSRQRF
jgi:hypothetical protein